MRISLIGAGRVAYHLVKILQQQHQIVNLYSRNFQRCKDFASSLISSDLEACACEHIEQMDTQIDLLIIAVTDQSIAALIQQLTLHFNKVLIVHSSGSTDLSVLTQHHARAGVFYPLQTFSLEREIDWSTTPLFVEAAEAEDLALLTDLAASLTQRVYQYDSTQRLSLHLAAVFACNFSNYCYDMAKQVLDAQQVDFSLLYPLIRETAEKATLYDPLMMQTGPAMRADHDILKMHAQMLEQADRLDLKEVYALVSQQILQRQQLKWSNYPDLHS